MKELTQGTSTRKEQILAHKDSINHVLVVPTCENCHYFKNITDEESLSDVAKCTENMDFDFRTSPRSICDNWMP